MTVNKKVNEELNNLLDENITLVDVYANWCGPCKMLAPNIEKISVKMNIKVIKVDADENFDVVNTYKISSIPTLMIFKNKRLVSTTVGYQEVEQLEKWINTYQ